MRVRQASVASAAIFGAVVLGGISQGAEIGPGVPWRGAGAQPCFGIDGGTLKCPEAARTIAIRAGRLFDSNAGKMLTNQVVLINGERITEVGPAAQGADPGGRAGDRSVARDRAARTDRRALAHLQRRPSPASRARRRRMIAIQNAQADLRAGFTALRDMTSHGNGYADVDVRNAFDKGLVDGPRMQVSTRGIVWSGAANARPNESARRRGRDARRTRHARPCAIRSEQGADWIKLYPGGRLFVHADRRGALRRDLSASRAAGADRRNPSPEQEGGLPRLRRRGTAERDHRRLRHDRARLRLDPGAAQHDGGEEARLRSDAGALHRAVHGRQRQEGDGRQVPHDPDLREGRDRWRRRRRASR